MVYVLKSPFHIVSQEVQSVGEESWLQKEKSSFKNEVRHHKQKKNNDLNIF